MKLKFLFINVFLFSFFYSNSYADFKDDLLRSIFEVPDNMENRVDYCRQNIDRNLIEAGLATAELDFSRSNYKRKLNDEKLILLVNFFPNLQKLNLAGSFLVTNHGIENLSRLANLKRLILACCPNITDAGLLYLSRMPLLEYLDISLIYNYGQDALCNQMEKGIFFDDFNHITILGMRCFLESRNICEIKISARPSLVKNSLDDLRIFVDQYNSCHDHKLIIRF